MTHQSTEGGREEKRETRDSYLQKRLTNYHYLITGRHFVDCVYTFELMIIGCVDPEVSVAADGSNILVKWIPSHPLDVLVTLL